MDEFENTGELRKVFSGEIDLSSENEKSTLKVGEKDILRMADAIRQNRIEDQMFAINLDRFLENGARSSEYIYVCKTSNALAISGADKELDVVIAPRTIAKCMADPEVRYHGHGLTRDILQRIPEELRNPVMIFKGNKDSSLVVITRLKDNKSRGVMVAISMMETEKFKVVNRISSIYGRNNFINYLRAQLQNENLISANEKEANEMLHSAGLQLPLENTFISFNDSIAYTMQNVKGFEEKINERRKNIMEETKSLFEKEKNAKTQVYLLVHRDYDDSDNSGKIYNEVVLRQDDVALIIETTPDGRFDGTVDDDTVDLYQTDEDGRFDRASIINELKENIGDGSSMYRFNDLAKEALNSATSELTALPWSEAISLESDNSNAKGACLIWSFVTEYNDTKVDNETRLKILKTNENNKGKQSTKDKLTESQVKEQNYNLKRFFIETNSCNMVALVDDNDKAFIIHKSFNKAGTLEMAKNADYKKLDECKTAEDCARVMEMSEKLIIDFKELMSCAESYTEFTKDGTAHKTYIKDNLLGWVKKGTTETTESDESADNSIHRGR